MKIYTKTGDKGTTSLFGGRRVEKNSVRIRAYGDIDELNSQVGMVIAKMPGVDLSRKLLRVQSELFVLGTDLATPQEVSAKGRSASGGKVPRVKKSFITRLEKEIDDWQKKLPEIRNFILPGGSEVGARLHLARAIARRAERAIVDLSSVEKINRNAPVYINRLSDWFFVLARYVNKLDNATETIWKGRVKT